MGTQPNPYLSPIGGQPQPTEVRYANSAGLLRRTQTQLTPWFTTGPWTLWPRG